MHYEITSQPSKAGNAYTLNQIINMWSVGDLTQNDTVATAHKPTEAEIELIGVLSEAFTPTQYTARELIDLCEPNMHSNQKETPKVAQVKIGHITIPRFQPIDKSEVTIIRKHSHYNFLRYVTHLLGIVGMLTLLVIPVLLSPVLMLFFPLGLIFILGVCGALDAWADSADLLHHIYRGLEED